MTPTVSTISDLKDILDYRTAIAFLAILLVSNVALFSLLLREQAAHVKSLRVIIPVADKLAEMVKLLDMRKPRNGPQGFRAGD